MAVVSTYHATDPDIKLRLLLLLCQYKAASVTRPETKAFLFFVENCRLSPLERDLDRGSA